MIQLKKMINKGDKVFNVKLLLNKNLSDNKYKIKLLNKRYIYTIHDTELNFNAIYRFVRFVNSITIKLPICVELKNITFVDKLSYVLLECICYHLIAERNMKIFISFSVKKSILGDGIISSPLNLLGQYDSLSNQEKFIKKFQKDGFNRHYRRLIQIEENANGSSASKVSSEIESFLKLFQIEREYVDDVTEVIGELIDNALEHSNTDCLIDVDVTTNYSKEGDFDGVYYGVNISILNFSDILLGDKIKQIYASVANSAFDKLNDAYKIHSSFWNENYTEDDFFVIAAFQHKISGRGLNSNTGGTGLTQLISVLESKSDAYNCYMISGDKALMFRHELLKQDIYRWVGFNNEHDFVNYPPENGCFIKSPLYFPGVAYNLNFVLKKEQSNE